MNKLKKHIGANTQFKTDQRWSDFGGKAGPHMHKKQKGFKRASRKMIERRAMKGNYEN